MSVTQNLLAGVALSGFIAATIGLRTKAEAGKIALVHTEVSVTCEGKAAKAFNYARITSKPNGGFTVTETRTGQQQNFQPQCFWTDPSAPRYVAAPGCQRGM